MMRDITEANRLKEQLIQSEKLSAMGRMASQLAHELNNPIYGIMNCLELAKAAVPEGDARKRFFDLAEVECKRTSGLLVKMLKYFQPDHETPGPTNINLLLEETLLFYEKQFSSLNIKVATDLGSDLPTLTAVEGQLKQAFINIIINANNAMPIGGTLTVVSRYLSALQEIQVSIADTGVGIPAADVERIFEAFYSTKSEVRGVGLGLSICYEVIKNHGGHIDVRSEVGKGTVFTIHLPVQGPG
jgi:two-component system NtrC family sensor kinase